MELINMKYEETQNFRFFHALFKNLCDKQTKKLRSSCFSII